MAMMGGNWCYIDPLSKGLYVLQLRHEFNEELTENWNFHKEWNKDWRRLPDAVKGTAEKEPRRRLTGKSSSCLSKPLKEAEAKKREEPSARKRKAGNDKNRIDFEKKRKTAAEVVQGTVA